ncbi:hypothetical protein IEQ34_026302 [Dendrobium chrysotoxum]|uniref:Uncharacterized protein n=1 Tax=Dendrobium chrysotoxum TaxID=161865 RepID=A0AAV7FIP3_DENCH|nr:hypothetical protein IEQ34_026302 [Dendrobium chrysotoxum]
MLIEKLEVPSPPTAEPEVQWREPPTIRRLEESVANRIAAGEVVQRPSSVVKELVENSLDAGATSISVVVKDGGLKLIQVSDNGHGIRNPKEMAVPLRLQFGKIAVMSLPYEDLPILCERHTTSKLTSFEDLQTIKSMGFRGEALASMTYVGHVTVMTITDGQLHGYRVSYRDGVMEHEPKPCAAVKGTQIMVENLFYNMLARRKALQSASDDYPKIVDLISRFAIYHTNVSFTCRKHGANKADVSTVIAASRLDAIKMVYGMPIARDLMEIGASDNNPTRSVFEMDGFISSANYMAKKTTMVLFINALIRVPMARRRVESLEEKLEGEVGQLRVDMRLMNEHISAIEGRFENLEDMMKKIIEMQLKASPTIPRAEPMKKKFLEEMMRKLMEMRSKIPPTVPIANPNQDLIGIPLAESKRNEIGREEFDEKSSFHQVPPLRAPRRGEIGFSDGGIARREFYCGGGGVVNYYGRLFG